MVRRPKHFDRPAAAAGAGTITSLTVAVLMLGSCTASARPAQPPPAGGPNNVAAAPPRFDTLDKALERVRRDESQKPLLIVDAANTRPAFQRPLNIAIFGAGSETSFNGEAPVPPGGLPALAPRRDGTLLLRDVAAFFDRKLASAGSVSVLAPTTMTVLNTRPGKPNLAAGLNPRDTFQMLLASLTPGQWRALGGERGLGAGDLSTPAQRSLFASLFPDPCRMRRQVVVAGPGGVLGSRADNDSVTLSPDQRAGVRLILLGQANLFVPQPDRPKHFWHFRLARERPEGASYVEFEPAFHEIPQNGLSRTEAYGVTLRQEAPSRAKPGDLAFDAARLDAPITLESGGESAAAPTVGELVKRAGDACRLELYADARVAGLPVTVLGGGTARSGDVLRALALAVTGAFRRLPAEEGTAWVLADDVAGIGTRQARIQAWLSAAGAQIAAQRQSLTRQIARQRPAQDLRFAPDDPYTLPVGVLRVLESAGPKSRLGDLGAAVNVSDLPPAFQRLARDAAAAAAGKTERAGTAFNETGGRTGPGQVGVAVRTVVACVVPGQGVVASLPGVYGSVDDLLDPYPFGPPPASPTETAGTPADLSRLPASVAVRALLVRLPKDVGEATTLVREARRRGLNQLWLALPGAAAASEAQTQTVLKAAIAAGETSKTLNTSVGIVAVVPVLRQQPRDRGVQEDTEETAFSLEPAAPKNSPGNPNDDQDRNILGETRAQEARRLAQTPPMPGAYPNAGDPGVERRRRERLLGAGDLLRIDRPGVTARLTRDLADLAALPGLAGLVLDQTAAPGYALSGAEAKRWAAFAGYGGSVWGYTPALRLGFLRQNGMDPVDMNVNTQHPDPLEVPFFPGPRPSTSFFIKGEAPQSETTGANKAEALNAAWLTFRYEANRRLLADLFAGLRGRKPDLPLFLAERVGRDPWRSAADAWDDAVWYSRWERPDALPHYSFLADGSDAPPPAARQARQFSSRNLWRVGPWPGRDRFPEWVPKNLPELAKDWNGVVFDLRQTPADQVLAALRSGFAQTVPHRPAAPGRDTKRSVPHGT